MVTLGYQTGWHEWFDGAQYLQASAKKVRLSHRVHFSHINTLRPTGG